MNNKMPVEYRTGDLFSSDADALAHGCNCQGVMGAGIAIQFKKRYPEMFKEYRNRCLKQQFVVGSIYSYSAFDRKRIYNLGTQQYPGACASLVAIKVLLAQICDEYFDIEEGPIRSVAIPRIGCGLGGLNWLDVKEVIEEVGSKTKIKLITYTL